MEALIKKLQKQMEKRKTKTMAIIQEKIVC